MKFQNIGQAEPNGSYQPLFYADIVNLMGKVKNGLLYKKTRKFH